MQDEIFMKKAIELSKLAVEHGNEPFGAVLVKDDQIVFTNENQIYTRHDPTFTEKQALSESSAHRPPLQTYMNILSIPAVNPALCAVVPWYG